MRVFVQRKGNSKLPLEKNFIGAGKPFDTAGNLVYNSTVISCVGASEL